jgi:hypothetical protein
MSVDPDVNYNISFAGFSGGGNESLTIDLNDINTLKIKNVNTLNYFTLLGLPTPFNDIYNSTGSTILATNQSEYNVTLSPGDTIYVADYTSALNFSVSAPSDGAEVDDPVVPFSFSAVSNNGVPISQYYISDGAANYSYPTMSAYTLATDGITSFTLYAIDAIGSVSSTTVRVDLVGGAIQQMEITYTAAKAFAQSSKGIVLLIIVGLFAAALAVTFALSHGESVDVGSTVSGFVVLVIAALALVIMAVFVGLVLAGVQ